MNSSRPLNSNEIEIQPLHICIAFIEEYKLHRDSGKPDETPPKNPSFLRSIRLPKLPSKLSTERRDECDDVIKKINNAVTYQEKSKIIDLLSEFAQRAQKPKEIYDKFNPTLVSWFVKKSSLWSKTLHAVRTCWVMYLQNEYKSEFEQEIADLQQKLASLKASIDKNLGLKLTINKADETEKKRIFNALLDRQDLKTLKDARADQKFPAHVPTCEGIISGPKIKIYREFPTVYNPNFYSIFYDSAIHCDPRREVNFNEVLKERLPKYSPQQVAELNILTKGFFEPIIVRDEFLNAEPTLPSAEPEIMVEKKSDNTETRAPIDLTEQTLNPKNESASPNPENINVPILTSTLNESMFAEKKIEDTDAEALESELNENINNLIKLK